MSLDFDRCLYPAVPVTFRKDGTIDFEALKGYAKWLDTQPITGIAVWAHTGRGLKLPSKDREQVYKVYREALSDDKKIICGVGASTYANEDEFIDDAKKMGEHAKSLGADGILAYAPSFFRSKENQDELIVKYHTALDSLGLDMVLFYLYEAAGGITYSLDVLRELFALKNAVAIKMATLDSVMTYQDVSNLIAREFPEKILITGEDRMFGYTVMRGGKGALVGIGSAFTKMQKALIDAYYDGDFKKFVELTILVDKLAEVTFIKPMEGYIQRMLHVLVLQGLVPENAAYDPYGPGVSDIEKEAIKEVVKELEGLGW
ncbi:MAG: dihydrodipicolinate synthase family protein [Firmicutes bacterium]|nr:dihydrodipicolinate synthase family protein [Bacillota bacterium]